MGNYETLLEPETEKKVRVQLDFEKKDIRTINDLVAQLDLGTRAELFRSGIRLLRWMVQKKVEGCTVVAITPDNRYIEPEFDFFRHVSPTPRRAAHRQAGREEESDLEGKRQDLEEMVHG